MLEQRRRKLYMVCVHQVGARPSVRSCHSVGTSVSGIYAGTSLARHIRTGGYVAVDCEWTQRSVCQRNYV